MFARALATVYEIAIFNGMNKISWLEEYFNHNSCGSVAEDDLKSTPETYRILFSHKNTQKMETLYSSLLMEMNGRPYVECIDFLSALAFLQVTMATGLWKYHLKIGGKLESFTREFDRLDNCSEQLRLYESAQTLK